MVNIQQILKVLKNERECIARQSRPLGEMPQCRKDDNGVKLCEYCDLCLPDEEILAVYDHLIEETEIAYKFASRVDEDAREHFKGICPYTDKPCEKWTCGICEVEQQEREFAESEDND